MIIIKNKLVIIVIILLSLTVYTIHGGIIDNKETEVTNFVDDFFDTVKRELGEREIDIVIRENIKYQINNIDIDNNTASVEIELTGLDLAQSFYEMDMFHTFYREFSLSSDLLFTEPIMDTYDVYIYILNKNIKNTQTANLTLHMNKSNGKWDVVNKGEVYRTIENSSIDLKTLSNKSYDNLENAREIVKERYSQEQTDLTFEEYWADYLFDFITNAGYVAQFPFEEQQFMP